MTTLCKVQLAAAGTHAQVCPCLRVGMRVSPDTSSVSSLDNVRLPCVAPGLSPGESTVRAIEQSTLNGISHKRSHQGCAQTISVTTQATWVTSLLSVMLSSTPRPIPHQNTVPHSVHSFTQRPLASLVLVLRLVAGNHTQPPSGSSVLESHGSPLPPNPAMAWTS